MPPRARLIAGLALGAAACGAAALTPWSVGTERAAAFVGAGLASAHGLEFSARGPASLVLLPLPRLTFVDATVRDASGRARVEASELSAALGLTGLLGGRAEITEVAARGARIALPDAGGADELSAGLAETVRTAALRLAGEAPHLRRLVLRDAALVRRVRGGERRLDAVDLTLSWPRRTAALEATGGFSWNGAPVRFELTGPRPASLAAGQASEAALDLVWPNGRVGAEGTLVADPARPLSAARWTGSVRLVTGSLRESLAWLGVPAALGPLVEGLDVEARAEASAEGVTLASVRARVAGAVLDGAAGATLSGGRLAVSGTLATDEIDLGPLLAPLAGALAGGAPTWAGEPFDLAGATGGDLDLRLSAGRVGAGPLRLDDVAARLVVREGEVEALIGRASLRGGTLKGRVGVAAGYRGAELKLQGGFQGVDAGALLADLGQFRWVQGRAGGQAALETTGATPAELAAGLGGRVTLSLDEGEIAGISLEDVLRGGAAGRSERRVGRTPFERAELALRFVDGVGEITEASLRAPALLAGLRGQVSLAERSLGARAEVASRDGAARPALFDVAGSWDRPTVAAAPAEAAPPALPPGGRPLVGARPAAPPQASAFAPKD